MPDSPLVQTGLLILRAMWPGAINHLLRSLPAPLTRSWVESLQPLMDESLAQIAGLPLLSHAQDKLRSLPISKGGLALPDLGDLAMAARLAALAAIPGHPNAADYKRKCIDDEAADLTARLNALTRSSVVPIVGTVHNLPEGRSHKGLQHKLCHAIYISYVKELQTTLAADSPLLQIWQFHTSSDRPGPPASHPGQGSWLLAPPLPHLQLTDREVQLGLRHRLGLPCYAPGHRCQRHLANGNVCGQALDPAGDHAAVCCTAIRTHRHNAIRDHICRYGKTCGLMAEVEQMMPPPPPLARLADPQNPFVPPSAEEAMEHSPLTRPGPNDVPQNEVRQRAPKRADVHTPHYYDHGISLD